MNNLVFNETASQLKTIIYGTDSSGNSVPMQIGEGGQMVVGGTVDIGSAITIGGGTVDIGTPVTIGASTFTSSTRTISLLQTAGSYTETFDVSTNKLNNFYVYSGLTGSTDSITAALFISPTTADGYLVYDKVASKYLMTDTVNNAQLIQSVLSNIAVVSITAAAALTGASTVTVIYNGQA